MEIEEVGERLSTVEELHKFCGELIEQGRGQSKLYFDTEAMTYPCHLVGIDYACWSNKALFGEDMLVFHDIHNKAGGRHT